MTAINDQDRFLSGQLTASMPKHLIEEGSIIRLLNGRFTEGAITNAIAFDELDVLYHSGRYTTAPNSNVPYDTILKLGDVQLLAPLQNTFGTFLIAVISGILFKIDLETLLAYDITPQNASLPNESLVAYPLSYLDNAGGISGSGGYLVIFNYPNRPIFINHLTARLSDASDYEMPVSRLGATGAGRSFVISADNLMYASDPLGGNSSLAPLTFEESLKVGEAYYGQVFTIGSSLDRDFVTNICRIPRMYGASQDLLAQNLLVSTKYHKYIISAGTPRADWEDTQFITYAGTCDGIAGPLSATNIGNSVVYISTAGRIKLLSEDMQKNESMIDNYFDENLGQYLCCWESNFSYRKWYRTLDHSRSVIKYVQDRLYATVYPVLYPARNRYNDKISSPSHKALAVGSLDSETQIGAVGSITWEGFYDWFNPVTIATIQDKLYVIAKDEFGRNRFYVENFLRNDDHVTTIITRGYFGTVEGASKSVMKVVLYFRELAGTVNIKISYLVNGEWVCGSVCTATTKTVKMNIKQKCKTDSWSVPLRIEIEHKGCKFELENIKVSGEVHKDEK